MEIKKVTVFPHSPFPYPPLADVAVEDFVKPA
jgi:hypothetical protein